MRILSLELVGYERLLLRLVFRIKLTFTEIIQLILGTNGSGKSSVMHQLSPLPGEKDEFTKDGMKKIVIEHRGVVYTLTSVFSPKVSHSFVDDAGRELNPGGTTAVQKELCAQVFNYTPDIHELVMGEQRFTDMSLAERRFWFTLMNPVDFTYILGVYNRARERLRDVQGATKTAKRRLVVEEAKVLSRVEREALEAEVATLQAEVDLLIGERAPVTTSPDEACAQVDRLLVQLEACNHAILSSKLEQPKGARLQTEDDILAAIERIGLLVAGETSLITAWAQESEALSKTEASLREADQAGLAQLSEQITPIREKILHLYQGMRLKSAGVGPEDIDSPVDDVYTSAKGYARVHGFSALASLFDAACDQITDVLLAMPSEGDTRFSAEKLQTTGHQLVEIGRHRQKLSEDLASLSGRIRHMQSHSQEDRVVCPRCSHAWIPGFNALSLEAMQEEAAKLSEAITQADKDREEIAEAQEAIRTYRSQYAMLVQTFRTYPMFESLWNTINHRRMIFQSPAQVLATLERFKLDLVDLTAVDTLETNITQIQALMQTVAESGFASVNEVVAKREHLEAQAGEATMRVHSLRKELGVHKTYLGKIREIKRLGEQLESLRAQVEDGTTFAIEMLRRQTIIAVLRTQQAALYQKEEVLAGVKQHACLIEDLNRQIADGQDQEAALALLVKQLSPSEGLIAEGMLGFINTFVADMNALIKRIWTYPFQIQACQIEEGEVVDLDYKFPIKVHGQLAKTKDVKKTSSGMKEVTNLAFRIVALKYLDLADAPLMLDEFAANLDSAHRVTANALIKNIIEQTSFSQLFMISHYEAAYGAFTNAQVCVMDAENIVTPQRYNEHVEFA